MNLLEIKGKERKEREGNGKESKGVQREIVNMKVCCMGMWVK